MGSLLKDVQIGFMTGLFGKESVKINGKELFPFRKLYHLKKG